MRNPFKHAEPIDPRFTPAPTKEVLVRHADGQVVTTHMNRAERRKLGLRRSAQR